MLATSFGKKRFWCVKTSPAFQRPQWRVQVILTGNDYQTTAPAKSFARIREAAYDLMRAPDRKQQLKGRAAIASQKSNVAFMPGCRAFAANVQNQDALQNHRESMMAPVISCFRGGHPPDVCFAKLPRKHGTQRKKRHYFSDLR